MARLQVVVVLAFAVCVALSSAMATTPGLKNKVLGLFSSWKHTSTTTQDPNAVQVPMVPTTNDRANAAVTIGGKLVVSGTTFGVGPNINLEFTLNPKATFFQKYADRGGEGSAEFADAHGNFLELLTKDAPYPKPFVKITYNRIQATIALPDIPDNMFQVLNSKDTKDTHWRIEHPTVMELEGGGSIQLQHMDLFVKSYYYGWLATTSH
eukprot:c5369_g1_i1.p1 GENE.c5369_g1_i1~~c5369_g1_i1.p1  ORF type:complete len:220 (-),score=75.60 c5369_g1_i1:90-716(-)